MKKILGIALALLLTLAVPAIADDISMTVDVQKYMTATFSYDAVDYNNLVAGSSNNPAPNQLSGVYNVSVDTNFAYNVSASGTNFTSDGHSFNVNNLKVDTNSTAGNLAVGSAVALSSSPQVVDSYAYTETENYHGFWLSIPAGQYSVEYSSTVTVTYESQ